MTDGGRPSRENIKFQHLDWKEKLRQRCLRRVQEERSMLLWKIRSNGQQTSDQKGAADSTFWHIVTDELEKIKYSPLGNCLISNSENDDILWDYDYLCFETENEDLMIEMEEILYRDLREERIQRELELIEKEDEYLAQAVLEHMQINDDQVLRSKKIWCPVCKRGELRQTTHHAIHCTDCKLLLELENDKVDLEFLRVRLAELHMEHLDRGCRALPEFCMETRSQNQSINAAMD